MLWGRAPTRYAEESVYYVHVQVDDMFYAYMRGVCVVCACRFGITVQNGNLFATLNNQSAASENGGYVSVGQ